ncbi:hypothetical protein ACTG15_05805 [Aeromonas sp. 164P]
MQTYDFGLLNYVVLFGYLIAMMLVGFYFAKRQKTADDYFRGGGRIPGWAAGVSVFATTLKHLCLFRRKPTPRIGHSLLVNIWQSLFCQWYFYSTFHFLEN